MYILFYFSLGRLPPWAQKTIAGDAGSVSKTSNSPLKAVVRGKWAQRAEKNDYKDYYLEPGMYFPYAYICKTQLL